MSPLEVLIEVSLRSIVVIGILLTILGMFMMMKGMSK